MPSPGGPLGRLVAGPRTLLLFLLLALLVQGGLVQSHLHFAQQAGPFAASSDDRVGHLSRSDPRDPALDCRLCQEAALAGAYVLPPPVGTPTPPATDPWIATTRPAAFILRAALPHWHSRAPPR